MPWHSINYATIFVLNYATKPGILGNHFSAIRARHLRGLHISRSPMPFGRPARVHSIAIINESRYTTFFHSPILSFTDFPILFRCNPSPSRSPLPSSLVTVLIGTVLRFRNRRGEEFVISFSYRARCFSPTPLREKLDFRSGISNSFLRLGITGRKFNLTSITGSDTRRNHA